MPLTPAQKTTLKADILANFPSSNDAEIAAAYNLLASPDFWVWRTSVSKDEITQKPSVDATSFIWAGNGFIARSAGEISGWLELFASGTCNPSLANVRQAFTDIFNGTGNAASNRTHLLACGRRKAKRGEKLLSTGTGSTAVPATMGFEGDLSIQDVVDALSS